MRVYKLFRKRKDGTLGPLFINARLRVPVGQWLDAECHPTKGYSVREGWHSALRPYAPHLKDGPASGRVWCQCSVIGNKFYERPESQGGTWVLSDALWVEKELSWAETLELREVIEP